MLESAECYWVRATPHSKSVLQLSRVASYLVAGLFVVPHIRSSPADKTLRQRSALKANLEGLLYLLHPKLETIPSFKLQILSGRRGVGKKELLSVEQ